MVAVRILYCTVHTHPLHFHSPLSVLCRAGQGRAGHGSLLVPAPSCGCCAQRPRLSCAHTLHWTITVGWGPSRTLLTLLTLFLFLSSLSSLFSSQPLYITRLSPPQVITSSPGLPININVPSSRPTVFKPSGPLPQRHIHSHTTSPIRSCPIPSCPPGPLPRFRSGYLVTELLYCTPSGQSPFRYCPSSKEHQQIEPTTVTPTSPNRVTAPGSTRSKASRPRIIHRLKVSFPLGAALHV